jgi:hypothetical protein
MHQICGLTIRRGKEKIPTLNLSGNSLCDVSSEIQSWADAFDPGWLSRQRCSKK